MMAVVKSFKDLIVWQKGIQLVTLVYKLTSEFPTSEKFGLVSQMRRSAISIPSNIAEGWGRKSTGSYMHFLSIARGSLFELETQVTISKELCYLNETDKNEIEKYSDELSRILYKLIAILDNKN